jgi:proline racemase
VQSGRVPIDPSGTTEVRIDVPSGRVLARVATTAERVASVDFVNVASYLLHEHVVVPTSRGDAACVVAFGGAIYAHVPAATFGLSVDVASLSTLIAISREIKAWLNTHRYAEHPSDARLSGIYGVIFFDDLGTDANGDLRQRNVTVFADGEVDRSPCGSGTCSRVAALHATGALPTGRVLLHSSIANSTWRAGIAEVTQEAGHDAVIPIVTGSAFRTGEHRFVVDPDDDMVPGFVLR